MHASWGMRGVYLFSVPRLQGYLDATYKTSLCASLASGAPCQIGPRCSHAHSLAELRVDAAIDLRLLPPDFKAALCDAFLQKGLRQTSYHKSCKRVSLVSLRSSSASCMQQTEYYHCSPYCSLQHLATSHNDVLRRADMGSEAPAHSRHLSLTAPFGAFPAGTRAPCSTFPWPSWAGLLEKEQPALAKPSEGAARLATALTLSVVLLLRRRVRGRAGLQRGAQRGAAARAGRRPAGAAAGRLQDRALHSLRQRPRLHPRCGLRARSAHLLCCALRGPADADRGCCRSVMVPWWLTCSARAAGMLQEGQGQGSSVLYYAFLLCQRKLVLHYIQMTPARGSVRMMCGGFWL